MPRDGTGRGRGSRRAGAGGRAGAGRVVLVLLALAMPLAPGARSAPRQGDPATTAAGPPTLLVRWHHRLAADRALAARAYADGRPLLADAEYDALTELVAALEAAWPGWTGAAPVGLGAAAGARPDAVAHGRPMGSLARLDGLPALETWVAGLTARLGASPALVLEPKLDGVALELVYERGRLVRALTRGDGRRGREVSAHLAAARGVPTRLTGADPPPRLDVRGELLVRRDDLARYAARCQGPPPVDGRSLAAGSLALADPSRARERPLTFVAHGLGLSEGLELTDQAGLLARLEALGFETLRAWQRSGDAADLWRAHQGWEADRDALPWACDGTVVKLADLSARRRLGVEGRHPVWARALKFSGRRASTRVTGLRWTVGRSGRLTPVAELEPVRLGGALVSAVSLHGADWLARSGLAVGDRVLIERAGGTIPVLLGVLVSAGAAPPGRPEVCPACAVDLSDGRCRSPACPAVLARRLEHLAGSGALDIDGLGPALCERLVRTGLVVRLADLFLLTPADLVQGLGWSDGRARALVQAVDRGRRASWSRWLVGLGLPGVGAVTARALAAAFPDGPSLLAAGRDQLLAVPGVGPVLADELLALARDPLRRARAQALLDQARPPLRAEAAVEAPGVVGP